MAITLSPTFGEVQQNLRDIFGYVLGEDVQSCRASYGTGGYFWCCFDLPPASLADPTRLLTKFILTGKANIPATAESSVWSTLIFMNGQILGRVEEEYRRK